MKDNTNEIKAAIQVQKPAAEVFEAIVDPEKMSGYFIASGTGRMEEGKELIWRFPEFDEDAPVRVGEVEQDKYVSYYWDAGGAESLTEITLQPVAGGTVVTVTEKNPSADNIEWLKGNTEGWANFLACLKAYLEYGINLREGAFDFLRKENAS